MKCKPLKFFSVTGLISNVYKDARLAILFSWPFILEDSSETGSSEMWFTELSLQLCIWAQGREGLVTSPSLKRLRNKKTGAVVVTQSSAMSAGGDCGPDITGTLSFPKMQKEGKQMRCLQPSLSPRVAFGSLKLFLLGHVAQWQSV